MNAYEGRTCERSLAVISVSVYLLFVGLWLVLTRRIRVEGMGKALKRVLSRPYVGELKNLHHDQGHSWVASVPPDLLSDKEAASCIALFEDDRPLGPGHSTHDDIRRHGKGRFSHWGAQVYLSTSDNTNPDSNGRRYYVKEIRQ